MCRQEKRKLGNEATNAHTHHAHVHAPHACAAANQQIQHVPTEEHITTASGAVLKLAEVILTELNYSAHQSPKYLNYSVHSPLYT